jgi:signal transduction histidine kinase
MTIMTEPPANSLSERYLAALKTHVEQGRQTNLSAASQLGSEAVAAGLETLDLAAMHDEALAAMGLSNGPGIQLDEMTKRAAAFFTEANIPIEKTHRLALEARVDLENLNVTLAQRTQDLVDSRHALQLGITQRKIAVESLRVSEDQSEKLLKEARDLQEHLQGLVHQILTAHEDERRRMSLALQDEIAQTLLGIHVRLLALEKELSVSTDAFKKEIAGTQQMLEKSVKEINRMVGEFGITHED